MVKNVSFTCCGNHFVKYKNMESVHCMKLVLWNVSCSVVSDSVTPWTVAHQAPLFMGILQAGILEWVAMPFSRGSSQPRDRTWVSHIAGGFFTIWAMRKTLELHELPVYFGNQSHVVHIIYSNFSHSIGCLFVLFIIFFAVQNILFDEVSFYCCFYFFCLGRIN